MMPKSSLDPLAGSWMLLDIPPMDSNATTPCTSYALCGLVKQLGLCRNSRNLGKRAGLSKPQVQGYYPDSYAIEEAGKAAWASPRCSEGALVSGL